MSTYVSSPLANGMTLPTTFETPAQAISQTSIHSKEKDLPGGSRWVVQKFGGTSVGKFARAIAEYIIKFVSCQAKDDWLFGANNVQEADVHIGQAPTMIVLLLSVLREAPASRAKEPLHDFCAPRVRQRNPVRVPTFPSLKQYAMTMSRLLKILSLRPR